MNLSRFLLLGTAIAIASPATVVAGGEAPADESVVYNAPSYSAADIGYVELSFGSLTLGDDSNDGDFDGTPTSISGQAFARVGDFVLEVQSYGTTSTDAQTHENGSATIGVFGHYMMDIGPGTAGAFIGTTLGNKVDDEDFMHYHVIGIGYAISGFVFSAGFADHADGDDEQDDQRNLRFLTASYSHQFNDMWSIGVDGLIGRGNAFRAGTGGDGDARFHDLTIGVNYDLNERVRFTGSVTHFSLENDRSVLTANGTELSLGLSFAVGGGNSEARSAIPFDAPNLHRPISWSDEAF